MIDFVPWHVVFSAVLIAVTLALSLLQKLGLEGSVIWSCVRAAVQLVIVGYALLLIFDSDASLAWAWVWVAAMIVFASDTFRRRTPEVPAQLWLGIVAFGVASLAGLAIVFGLGIFDLTARTLVPVAGMLIGNSLSSTILAARRLVEDVRDKRDEVEARLALGQTPIAAVHPTLRSSLRTALIPQIERTKALGIVVLPGMMTGLILAGADPVDAVAAQLAIMYLILGAVAITTTIVCLGLRYRLFTGDARLVTISKPAAPDGS